MSSHFFHLAHYLYHIKDLKFLGQDHNGFLEKVYENALAVEFRKAGLKFGKQVGFSVMYDNEVVGDYVADFLVEGKVIVECRAMVCIGSNEKAQVINYLKATGNGVGLLLNFGREAEVKRVYWEHGENKVKE